MYRIIYKVTNLINGKFYIGQHKTDDLNDGYMGSGKILKRAIVKYGVENFKKEILHFCDSKEDMDKKERELVVLTEESYNLRYGGDGGFDYINKFRPYDEKERRRKLSIAHKGLPKNSVPGSKAGADRTRGKKYEEIFGSEEKANERKLPNSEWMSKNNPNREKVVCPHCGLKGSKPSMLRWHFENCKRKP